MLSGPQSLRAYHPKICFDTPLGRGEVADVANTVFFFVKMEQTLSRAKLYFDGWPDRV